MNILIILSEKFNALQAQARYGISNYDHSSANSGSATVEAALVLPFFLCALCTVCVIAQFLLVEASVYHATLHTARIYAKQESAFTSSDQNGNSKSSLKNLGGFLTASVIFRNYLDGKETDSSFVAGGRNGIILTSDSESDFVRMKAQFILKVPVPFFKSYMMSRKLSVRCRKFTGYVKHDSEGDDDCDDDTVYVSETGNVYHTNLNCYHLTVTITDPDQVRKIMQSSHYHKCEKCMNSTENPSQIFITKDGDCYHSSLDCSGLKRTVKAVNKSEIEGMRECSECAKHH